MVPLMKNKPLVYSICGTMSLMIFLAAGIWDEMAETFSLVPFPDNMHNRLVILIILDFLGSFAVDRFLRKVCGKAKIRPLRG